jgi:hypothetical protein
MNQPSLLSKQDILDYASRYVRAEDAVDFAHNGDLFCVLGRKIASDKIQAGDDGWEFQGYGICVGYTVDEQEIPVGKWLWMHFLSLAAFPPSVRTFRMQPPHVVKGGFQNTTRTEEYKIVKINALDSGTARAKNGVDAKTPHSPPPSAGPNGKVLEFRRKTAKKRRNAAGRR